MASLQEQIDALSRRISELAAQHAGMGKQLLALMNELTALRKQAAAQEQSTIKEQPVPQEEVIAAPVVEKVTEIITPITAPSYKQADKIPQPVKQAAPAQKPRPAQTADKRSTSVEEFLGKNVASKIGILITIIGIFIGARYAIEHEMVSPALRIVAGYIGGLALIGVALKLKSKYEAYSAVLMGGGLCVLYFITYIAWSFYLLLPQIAAFGLMLLFTAAIVYAAIWYNRVIIAHLGQVGAYAIPFLLSTGSGRYDILFTYVGIINAGILILSFFKNWRTLFHTAYILTWLIFSAWFAFSYDDKYFGLALTTLIIYFLLFYATFLAYKLIKREQYDGRDIFLLLSNAFLFYGFGYSLLDDHVTAASWPGIFTVINAIIHLGVSIVIRKLKLADRSLYFMVLGLVVVFLTIAVPVQFDGNWVTLLWTAEGIMLFYVGRTRNAIAYERLAAALLLLGFGSLVQDWINVQWIETKPLTAFQNIYFISGLLVAAGLGFITRLNARHKIIANNATTSLLINFFDYIVPVLLLITTYTVFALEIRLYFDGLLYALPASRDGSMDYTEESIRHFRDMVLFLYTQVFVVLVLLANNQVKSRWLATTACLGVLFMCVVLLGNGWSLLNDMAADYVHRGKALYFGAAAVFIRYLILLALAGMLITGTRQIKLYNTEPVITNGWWLLIYTMIIAAISAEYLCWTGVGGNEDRYKTGLSIIWGLYALALVVYGIWKKQKYTRLAAIGLFVITIGKLFIYDLSEAGTLTKTVSFISLGVILLLVSYLYNRYKDVLFGPEENK